MQSFARDAGAISGEWPQSMFTRLNVDSIAPLADQAAPPVSWAAQGAQRKSPAGQPQLSLHVQARTSVRMQCQRCLLPVALSLDIDRKFLFARDEAEAAQLDEETEDDVLVLEHHLDLAALIEDELILALPIVPRHEDCPQPLTAESPVARHDAAVASDKPHPFAALAALRRGGG